MKKICVACGTEYPENNAPEVCVICAEERQYVPLSGQQWTRHAAMLRSHKTVIHKTDQFLYELSIAPKFGIGQRAFLVISEKGNFLWDCIPLLNAETIDFINSKGGLRGIGISHPHYYSNMNSWADVFDCPIYIHEKDRDYVVYPSERIEFWKGKSKALWDDLSLINLGGHFDGGSVLMIQNKTEKGVMLCSDILQIAPSRDFIALMYSYPNYIPLSSSEIKRISKELEKLSFDTLFGAFRYQHLDKNVRQILKKSIERHFE